MLAADGRFETRIAPLLEVDGAPVSSTRIRKLLCDHGDVAGAARLLGAPYKLSGIVVHGEKRGRELGYPTANIEPDDRFVTPAHGIYACRTGEGRAAAVNIGVRPTFETTLACSSRPTCSTSTPTSTAKRISLTFVERLRGEMKFDGIDPLIEQMQTDVEATRQAVPVVASSEA